MDLKTDNPLVKIAALLIIAAQFGLLAHAAEHGAGDHEHDGVACHLAWNDDDTLVPATPTADVLIAVEPSGTPPVGHARAPAARPATRLPPPTGPPALTP